uniref:F-box domain-containing protein n=1 Tax=Mycena chlorophos TaxID=658473 RepID=A0ABQ0L7I9_MYCCL|nr:predicted protein [Mycena chlorophos]
MSHQHVLGCFLTPTTYAMQNADMLVPVPHLPLELEREIFELAAWHDTPTMLVARLLILVASRVRVWIEPLLHRVFHIETKEEIQALHDRLMNNPRHAASLRHLLVTCSTPEVYPALEYILRACSNLVELAPQTPPAPLATIADAKTEVYLAILALPRPLPLRILCAYGDSVHEDQEAQVSDLRFCVVYSSEYTDDWTQAAWGKAGFWELAEGRVVDRRGKAAASEAEGASLAVEA